MILRDAILAKRIGEARLERRREIIEGELIEVGGRVQVNANDDTVVWVRGWDESGGVFQSLNLTVKPLYRLPVLVARDPNVEYGHEIISINKAVLARLDDKGILPAFNVPNHAETHEWPDWPGTVGPDPLTIYPRAFGPGRVYVGPDDEGLEVSIAPFRYTVNGEMAFFRGTRRYDLAASQPVAGEALLLLVGVEATTGAVSVTAGETGPDDDLTLPPFGDVPAGVIGLCYLRLDGDQTRFTERDFVVDLRLLPGGGGAGVSAEWVENGLARVESELDYDITRLARASLLPTVGSPDYSTVTDAHTIIHSSGVIDGEATYVTQVDATHIAVAAGQGLIRVSNSPLAQLVFCEWAAEASIAIPAGASGVDSVRFVGIEYNAGVPQVTVRTTFNWNWYDDFPLARVSQDGTTLRILNAYAHAEDTVNKTRKFLRLNLPFAREEAPEGSGGLVIGDVATRYLSLSAGNIWHGFNRYVIAAINTSGAGRFDLHYRNGTGGFTHVTSQQQWPNTQYDDGDGTLATMTNNKYACLWVYLDVSDGTLDVLYGRAEYNTETAAQAEAAPATVPGHLQYHGKLLGRLIFQKSASAAALVQSVWATEFNTAGVTDHASLSNVTSDQHHAQSHTHSGDGSGTIALDAAPVSKLWESDAGAVAWATDASGNLTDQGTRDVYIGGDTAGLRRRYLLRWQTAYNVAFTSFTGWTWATWGGMATPSNIDISNFPALAAIWHTGTAKHFAYRAAYSSINGCLVAPARVSGINSGLRMDDGTDSNYSEFYVATQTSGLVQYVIRYRTGAGAVTTTTLYSSQSFLPQFVNLLMFRDNGGGVNYFYLSLDSPYPVIATSVAVAGTYTKNGILHQQGSNGSDNQWASMFDRFRG